MNTDEDINPFSDPSIRQATEQTLFVVSCLLILFLIKLF